MVDIVEFVDVDKIWITLGRFGKYQVKQAIIYLVAIWSCGFHVLSIVFIGYRPEYACHEVSTNVSMATDITVSYGYDKCSITKTVNDSGVTTVTSEDCQNGWAYKDVGDFAKERSIISEWDIVCERAQLAEVSQTLVLLGQGIGAFLITSLADRFGRKPTHIGCHSILFFIALATAFMPNFAGFAVMRALTGAFQQGTLLTVVILNLEMFPKEIRGNVEVFGILFWTTGIALVTPIAYIFKDMSWRYFQICLACLSSWSLVEWFFTDESLRWLIANGKVAQAKAVLKTACRVNNKDYDEVAAISGFREYVNNFGKTKEQKIELIPKADNAGLILNPTYGEVEVNSEGEDGNQAKTKTKSLTIRDLLKSRPLLFTSIILWFGWITNSTTYYGIMLISSNLAGDRFLNFFLGSVVEYPAAFMEYSMINRYGRKPTLILFHAICGVSLLIATILTTTAGGNSAMLLGSTAFTLIGKFAITGSFSTLMLYSPELYPTNMRNRGLGMASCAARIGGMLAPFARNIAEVALWAPGLIFAIMCAINAVSLLWIPETNQNELPQTIEECEQWYKENQFKLPCHSDRRAERNASRTRQNNSD